MYGGGGIAGVSQAEITRCQAQLHDLAAAIAKARETNQPVAERLLREQFNTVRARCNALVTQMREQETPSGVAVTVANVGEQVTRLLRSVGIFGGIALGVLVLSMLRRR